MIAKAFEIMSGTFQINIYDDDGNIMFINTVFPHESMTWYLYNLRKRYDDIEIVFVGKGNKDEVSEKMAQIKV